MAFGLRSSAGVISPSGSARRGLGVPYSSPVLVLCEEAILEFVCLLRQTSVPESDLRLVGWGRPVFYFVPRRSHFRLGAAGALGYVLWVVRLS